MQDDYEARLAADARRRRLWVSGVVALVPVVGAVIAVLASSAGGPCDRGALVTFLARPEIGVEALPEVCRLPEPLASGIARLGMAPPEMRSMLVAQLATEHPAALQRVCPRFLEGLAQMATVAPADKSEVLLAACPPATFAAFAKDDAVRRADPWKLTLASIVYETLRDGDEDTAAQVARGILRKP